MTTPLSSRPGPSWATAILLLALLGIWGAAACTDLKDVSQPSCTFDVAPPSLGVDAAGGTGKLAVTAAGVCNWSVTDVPPWITISGDSSGTGDGSVTYVIGANPGSAPRTGSFKVAGHTITVTQDASPCSFVLDPASESFDGSGGTGRVNLATAAQCAWTASSNAAWIRITTATSGTGPAAMAYVVDHNDSRASRTATLTIAGHAFAISQGGMSCSYTATASTTDFDAGGGAGVVTIGAADDCGWSAASDAGWLHITGGATGSGGGTVRFSVDANGGGARTGRLTIAGRAIEISQAAVAAGPPPPPPPPSCSFSISAGDSSFSGAGGTGTVAVTAKNGCSWTSSSSATWVHVTSNGTGSGNGTLHYTVDPNPLPTTRTATLTVAGAQVTVTESGTCSFSVLPTSASFDDKAHTGSIQITTMAGCSWTASSGDPWIVIPTDSRSGSGSAAVNYSVAANTGTKDRTGTMTIAGVTVTITQSAK